MDTYLLLKETKINVHTIVIIVLLALVGYHRTWSFRVWQPLGCGGGREGRVEGCAWGGGGEGGGG